VTCEKCNRKTNSEQRLIYEDYPEILVFNLNRFVYDMQTYDRKKLNDYFEFPLLLDMEKFKGQFESV